jgi:uncharacterized membrane protein
MSPPAIRPARSPDPPTSTFCRGPTVAPTSGAERRFASRRVAFPRDHRYRKSGRNDSVFVVFLSGWRASREATPRGLQNRYTRVRIPSSPPSTFARDARKIGFGAKCRRCPKGSMVWPNPMVEPSIQPDPAEGRSKKILRILLALAMIGVGITHFTSPDPFVQIVPAALPAPLTLVYLSGIAEIAGGVGILIPTLRRAAGVGLILLYIAVFPANINMAVNNLSLGNDPIPTWVLWARLPLQVVFIAWAYWVAIAKRRAPPPSNTSH